MNLRDLLIERSMTHKEFADLVGISAPYLSLIVTGKRKPGKNLAKRIEHHSGGLIKVEELADGTGTGYDGIRKQVKKKRVVKEKQPCDNHFSLL